MYLEMTEQFFGDDWVWTPLDASDSTEKVLQDFHSETAQEEGQRLYAEETEAYDRAMSREAHTSSEDRAAVDALKHLMGRR